MTSIEPSRDAANRRLYVRDGILICLGLKAMLLLLGGAVNEMRQDKPVRSLEEALSVWRRWDSLNYFELAENGYAPPDGSRAVPRVLPPRVADIGAGFRGLVVCRVNAAADLPRGSIRPGLVGELRPARSNRQA